MSELYRDCVVTRAIANKAKRTSQNNVTAVQVDGGVDISLRKKHTNVLSVGSKTVIYLKLPNDREDLMSSKVRQRSD